MSVNLVAFEHRNGKIYHLKFILHLKERASLMVVNVGFYLLIFLFAEWSTINLLYVTEARITFNVQMPMD